MPWTKYSLITLALVVVFFVVWEILSTSRFLGLRMWIYLVPPSQFLTYLYAVTMGGPEAETIGGTWMYHLELSLVRLALGLALGTVAGVLTGLMVGWSRTLGDILEPIVDALRPFPTLTLFPIIIVFLGLGLEAQVFLIGLGVFYVMFYNSLYGARSVDRLLVYSLRTMGASGFQIFRKAVLFSALPYIGAGIRTALAVALTYLVFAEMLSGDKGIGWIVLFAKDRFIYPAMFGGVITIALLGGVIVYGYTLVEKRVLDWYYKTRGTA